MAKTQPVKKPPGDKIEHLALNMLTPGKDNPRETYNLDELMASIATVGVLQPILVRPSKKGHKIISGNRRFKAMCEIAKANGGLAKHTIPCIVKDVDDETAFQIMTIENLQRENLTPLEEARAFKTYLENLGWDKHEDLAAKVGCKPSYIRKRTEVLALPEKALKMWESDKASFAHLSAMLLAKDNPELLKDMMQMTEGNCSAQRVLDEVRDHSAEIRDAIFDTADCTDCQHNTERQKSLFDVGFADAYCSNPLCFNKKTMDFAIANWSKDKRFKKFGTTRPVTMQMHRDAENFDMFHHDEKPVEKCKTCEGFVTVLQMNGKSFYEKACMDATCKRSLKKALQHESRKADRATSGKKVINADAPKVAWHGRLFREKFYMDAIPKKAEMIDPDSKTAIDAAILALTLLHSRKLTKEVINTELGIALDYGFSSEAILEKLAKLSLEKGKEILKKVTVSTVMDWDDRENLGTKTRDAIAKHFEIDIKAEWTPTEDYLRAKTRKELIDWATKLDSGKFKTLSDHAAKKHGKGLDAIKKDELVKAILECGEDFTGCTPSEIVDYDDEVFVPMNKRPDYKDFKQMDEEAKARRQAVYDQLYGQKNEEFEEEEEAV